MTIEQMREFAAQGGKTHLELADEIGRLSKRLAAIDSELVESIKNDDRIEYRKLTDEKEMLSKKIGVKRSQLAALPLYETRSDLRGSWNNYVRKYNAEFEKKYAAYKTARKALYKQFRELYEMQRRALDDRYLVSSMTDERRNAITPDPALDKLSTFETRDCMSTLKYNCQSSCAEAAFFIEAHEADASELAMMNQTILYRN